MEELIASSAFGYGIIGLLVAADGVLPVLPGETALVGGAVLAASGELELGGVIVAAIAGGFLGDNLSYLLGATAGARLEPRLFRGQRSRRRVAWAREQLEVRGPAIILTARFIPVGRTATTFSSGALGMAWPRFARIDALAVTAWAVYASVVGYYGSRVFTDDTLGVLLATLLLAGVIGIVAELLRRSRTHP